MIPLLTFFIVLVFSLLIVRIASVALTLTGMSSAIAKFEARSAWTGTGYSTHEADEIAHHPVRRQIVSWLMLLRGVGIVTVIATLVLSFAMVEEQEARFSRLAMLLGGLIVVWLVFSNKWVDRQLSKVILRALGRYTNIPVRDYGELLHLSHDFIVSELLVRAGDWMAEQKLSELNLPDEGILVLGVRAADGRFTGVPRGETQLHPGDTVILYGRADHISELDKRPAAAVGDVEHERKTASEPARRSSDDAAGP